ncbi:MAG: glycosyltransferase family 2 protein [Chitinophagaceae bacterium]|nr:glycosyltransferase family 2 protein [Chitinophagaceae bacterium]
MEAFKKVSIQIPTYNQRQFLAQAIESALMQDYGNLEIIIADDCSTDDTEAFVKKYQDSRIKYFRNKNNIGRVANYRKSLYEYCTGDWVVNLDGDDYYSNPQFISRGMNIINQYLQAGENVVIYQAAIEVKNEETGSLTIKQHKLLAEKEYQLYDNYYFGKYRKNKFFSHLTTLYDRKEALRIGFYEFNTLTTDFESIIKLSFYGKVVLDNTIAGVWRLHAKNATHNSDSEMSKRTKSEFDRIEGYAKNAFSQVKNNEWESKIKKENQSLHLELLAESGSFFSLVKYLFSYRRLYLRTPLLLAKALVKGVGK